MDPQGFVIGASAHSFGVLSVECLGSGASTERDHCTGLKLGTVIRAWVQGLEFRGLGFREPFFWVGLGVLLMDKSFIHTPK